LLILIGGLIILVNHERTTTEQYLRSLDETVTSEVPIGSDRKTAEAWLTSQRMTVSPDEEDAAQGQGIPAGQLGGVIRGDTRQNLFSGWNDISVYFFLDKEGKVIKHQVRHFHIGL
jgi:hypothetical protein